MGGPMFGESRAQLAKTEVTQIISLLGLRLSDHLLDLCCGNGRHLLEFTRKGYHVTGVDITAAYLEDLEEKARKECLDVNVLKRDARYYCSGNTYDAIYNLYASFGYFESESDNTLVLQNCYDSLKAGGKLLVNITEKSSTIRHIQPSLHYQIKGIQCDISQSISHDGQWIRFGASFTKNGHTDTIHYKVRLYPVSEICGLLNEIGFKNIACYESLSGRPHHDNSFDLYIVAQK